MGEKVGEKLGEKVGEKLGEKVGDKTGEKVGESLGEIHKLKLCQQFRLKLQALPYNCSECCCNIWQTTVQADVANFAMQLFRLLLQYMTDTCSG